MRMRRSVISAGVLVAWSAAWTAAPANTIPIITNVKTVCDPDTIRIAYDLDDPDGDRMTVLLRFAGSDFLLDAPAEDEEDY